MLPESRDGPLGQSSPDTLATATVGPWPCRRVQSTQPGRQFVSSMPVVVTDRPSTHGAQVHSARNRARQQGAATVQGNCVRQCRSSANGRRAAARLLVSMDWPITHTTAWSSLSNVRVNPARARVVIQNPDLQQFIQQCLPALPRVRLEPSG
jgi:hypothetical protein